MSEGSVRVEESVATDYIGPDKDVDWVRFTGDPGSVEPWPAARSWADDLLHRYPHTADPGENPVFWAAFPVHPRSVIAGLAYAFSEETLRAEIEKLADSLREAGCSGVLDCVREAPWPLCLDGQPVLHYTAVVGSVNLDDEKHPGDWVTRSELDQSDIQALTDHGLDWCSVPDGKWTLEVGQYCLALESSEVRATFHDLLQTENVGPLTLTCANFPDQARTVSLAGEGRIVYLLSSARDPLSPQAAVHFGLDLLTELAPHLTYGFALHTSGPMTTSSAYAVLRTKGWPAPWVEPNRKSNRLLEVSAGWDAFAVILHGPEFPPMPAEAPFILVRRVADRTLWSHNDAERWIDGTTARDPAELERTRRALGATLIPLAGYPPRS